MRAVQPFNEYITGASDSVAQDELDRLIAQYEWFTTARRAKALLSGEHDSRLALPLMFSPTLAPPKRAVPDSGDRPPPDEERLIERFLERGGYRIIPDGAADEDISETGEAFDDDGMLTEELAEIYRSQGFSERALEIYRKLSLLNPEKSIYFADIIARIEQGKMTITK